MKVMFYSPFANIWEHSFPEALLAESFATKDIEILAVRCNTMLQTHCVAMSAAGVGPEAPLAMKKQVCSACMKRRDLITRTMNFPATLMDDWVDPADAAQMEELISAVRPETWTSLEVDGIPLGRYAAYELWLNRKLVSTDLSPEVWHEYLGQLRNTLLTYVGAKRLLAAETPDAVIVYNDHYSVNHAFCAAAERAGIASYTIHGGQHMRRRAESLMMFTSNHTMEDIFRSAAWQERQLEPVDEKAVDLVGDHFSGLLEANSAFAYSSKFEGTSASELRSRLGVAPGAKVILAPMSSEDELMAVRLIDAIPWSIQQESLFDDQFQWVDYLFNYAKAHPEIHLVLRLHPRMFPNKREQVLSPVVSRIMALRDIAPANVTFNMPADGIGLYDLMQIVDVLVNFRSSVGAELSTFGIPVVVPANSDFYTYPSELNRTGHTLDQFRDLIDEALVEGWSIENSRRAVRWYAFLFGRVAVDFSDAVSSRPIAFRPKKPGPMLRLYSRAAYLFLQHGPLVRERLALRRRGLSPTTQAVLLDVVESKLDSASDSALWPPATATLEQETDAIRAYLLQLCDTLWENIDEPDSLAGRIRSHLSVVTR